MEVKTEKLPKTPLALYVKLYCKRKNTIHNTMCNNRIEATKSWLSLSQLEKEKFIEKHGQYQNKFKRNFANYLKNAEPYLKKKDPPSRKPDMVYEEPQPDANIVDNTLHTTQCNSMEGERCISNWTDLGDSVFQLETHQETIPAEDEQNTSTHDYMESVLVEPTPPSLKTGRELFELVKMMEVNHPPWISLSPAEKRSYNAAVLSLKKDYLKKYKTYLENLPSKELFDHYNIKCS